MRPTGDNQQTQPVIVGIDPGVATGAAVALTAQPAAEEVLDAISVSTRSDKQLEIVGDRHFTDAVRRARQAADRLLGFIDRWQPALVCIESFVDLESKHTRRRAAGQSGHSQLRWMTPLTIGMLDAELRRLGYEDHIRYQNPGVLAQLASEIARLDHARKNKQLTAHPQVVRGQHLLTSEHRVRAWAHASWSRERFTPDQVQEVTE